MADNNESFNAFSVENTMDMGMGNQELVQNLLSPETTTANPAEITPIIAEATQETIPDVSTKGKEITPPKSVNGKTDQEKLEGQSLVADFLSNNEDESEEEIITPEVKPKSNNTEEVVEEETEGSTQFEALYNDLSKLGVFTNTEGEDAVQTAEEFLERFNEEKKKGASEMVQNFIGQFGEDYQEAFDAIFVKGVNPKEYFGTYNQIVDFAEIDLTEESNQIKVLKQALTDQGFESEDVETEIERLRNYGDLESVAVKHHKVLVKKEAAKLQEMEAIAEKELQQKQNFKHQYVNNVQNILNSKISSKEFDGIPFNAKIAGELQDFLLVDKWKTYSGETLTDFDRAILDMKKPENHEMKVKLGLIMKILEKDPTLSTIQKTGITKKTNQLFSEVTKQVQKQKTLVSPSKKLWDL
jgi:hypothetical protein